MVSMVSDSSTHRSARLLLLPSYTGVGTIDDALTDPRAARLLWLEILVNDRLDLSAWEHHALIQDAYQKACRWYTVYKSLIESLLPRRPLPSNPGPIDQREYRTFIEAIQFAAALA